MELFVEWVVYLIVVIEKEVVATRKEGFVWPMPWIKKIYKKITDVLIFTFRYNPVDEYYMDLDTLKPGIPGQNKYMYWIWYWCYQ